MIQYRVWDGKVMHEPPHSWCVTDRGVARLDGDHPLREPVREFARWGHLGDWVVMQHTGLDDSEGTPIYEGDIVEYWSDRRDVVTWGGNGYRISGAQYRMIEAVLTENAVVLGNVYENPDLVDKDIQSD